MEIDLVKLKTDWVTELKSGKWIQGTDYLEQIAYGEDKSNDKTVYCCLGVLNNIAPLKSNDLHNLRYISNDPDLIAKSDPKLDYYWGFLFVSETSQEELVILNDTEEKSFKEIADYIEKNVVLEMPIGYSKQFNTFCSEP
jgi:hypothetical protein